MAGYYVANVSQVFKITLANLVVSLTLLVGFFLTEAVYGQAFPDLGNEPRADLIEQARDRGIVSGFPDGEFKPKLSVTREQMIVMIVGATLNNSELAMIEEQSIVAENTFSDVDASRWSARAIGFAVENGLISGYPDGTFRPSQKVTRAEAVVMNRAFIRLMRRNNGLTGQIPQYTDVRQYTDLIKHWAAGAVEEMAAYCFSDTGIHRRAEEFKPSEPASRAVAASIIVRGLQCLEAELKGVEPRLLDPVYSSNFLETGIQFCSMSPSNPDRGVLMESILSYEIGSGDLDWNQMASSKTKCVEGFLPAALHLNAITGIPASTMIGQAIQETGWCKSALSKKALNYHGQKAKFAASYFTHWEGGFVNHSSTESTSGSGNNRVSKFMKFDHPDKSFYSLTERLILPGLPYKACMDRRSDTAAFIRCIGKSWAVHRGYGDIVLGHRADFRHPDYPEFRLANCDVRTPNWQLLNKFN